MLDEALVDALSISKNLRHTQYWGPPLLLPQVAGGWLGALLSSMLSAAECLDTHQPRPRAGKPPGASCLQLLLRPLHSFLTQKKPSPFSSPWYVIASLALAGSDRKSMHVSPVTLPAGWADTVARRPEEWWMT
jgi:hypothetical protein